MTKKQRQHQSGCPVAFALDIFGDRWTLLILREIMIKGKRTYKEFLSIDEEIATNILADRLKLLESEGILNKQQDPQNRRSNIYTLTAKGSDLAPVLVEIIQWSGKHDTRPFALKETVNKMKKDKHKFEKMLRTSNE
jgi:DNA-binding HxlR family transcriptional regulator